MVVFECVRYKCIEKCCKCWVWEKKDSGGKMAIYLTNGESDAPAGEEQRAPANGWCDLLNVLVWAHFYVVPPILRRFERVVECILRRKYETHDRGHGC